MPSTTGFRGGERGIALTYEYKKGKRAKFEKMILHAALLIFGAGFADADPVVAVAPKSGHTQVVSSTGVIAHNFIYGKAIGKVLIKKNERIVAEVDGAKAISFSPEGSKLLLAEVVLDDDLGSFLIDVSGEEIFVPEGPDGSGWGRDMW